MESHRYVDRHLRLVVFFHCDFSMAVTLLDSSHDDGTDAGSSGELVWT